MLQKLTIKNIALIDSVEIPFSKGLNVLSGETGAGKSVIIDSLNFVLGAKADKTLIRTGQTECSVVAEFDVCDNQTINAVYQELDFENEDILIISRKFTIDGKSSIKKIGLYEISDGILSGLLFANPNNNSAINSKKCSMLSPRFIL